MYLIIFDVDGTLVDSQETILHGLQVGFKSVGLAMPDRKTALSIVGLSLEAAFEQLIGPDHADKIGTMAAAYRASKVERRLAGLDHDPLYPGAREAIERLHARPDTLLGIATGKARRGVNHMLDVHSLDGRFVTIQTADTSPSKPHPHMILEAMRETGAEPEKTVMIGDTAFDMEMARSAGAHALGVAWGYHDHAHLLDHGAQTVIESFAALDGALASILKLNEETV